MSNIKIRYVVDRSELLETLELLDKIEAKLKKIQRLTDGKEAQTLWMSWRSKIINSNN